MVYPVCIHSFSPPQLNTRVNHSYYTAGGMQKQKSSGPGKIILFGVVVAGGFIILNAIKRNQQQQSPTNQAIQSIGPELISTLKPYIQNAVDSAIQRSIQSVVNNTVSSILPLGTPRAPTVFKNNEERIIKRNADGFIESMKIIRNAEKNAAT